MEIDETIRVKTTFNQTQPNQDGNTLTSKGTPPPPPPPSSALSTSTSTSTSASSSTSEFGSIAPSQSQPPNGNLTHNYTFMSSNTPLPSNMSQPLFTSAATPIGLSGSSPSSSSSFSSSLSSSSSTWFSSPSAKSNRLKRTSEQFEAIHENEEDVSISRPSAVKKFKPDSDDEEDGGEDILGTIASQDEMDDELGGRTNTINRHGVNDERIRFAGDDTDSSFMTLLSKLAQLEFPHRNPAQREACPLCPLTFPLEEFADHVYKCITKLDDDEKKEQERLDAKLATEMAFADARRESHRRPFHSNRSHHHIDRVEGNSMDEGGDDEDEDDEKIERERERDRGRRRLSGPAEIERELLEKFESRKLTECRYGSQCNRTDAAHFIQLSHPEVPCPICNETFAVYEINAHVTLCLESPKPPTIKQTTISDAAMKEDGPIPSSTSSGTTSNRSPPSMGLFGAGAFSSKPVSIPSFAGGDGISSSSSLTRRSRRPHRSVSANQITSNPSSQEDVLSPPLGLDDDELAVADDEADDDDYKSPTVPSTSASDDQARPIHRSTSDCSLSLAQAAAVANMVLKRKAAAQTSTSSSTSELNDKSEKDPSLLELLSTFSTLGFTRERLEEMHAQHQAAMESGNTISNASSSSSKAATTASAAKID